jgi:hypothetical protein
MSILTNTAELVAIDHAAIAAAMGARGVEFLTFAGVNVGQFAELAAADQTKLSDLMPDSEWMPRLPLVPNADGTVTVGAVDGLDAWARPLPEPTDQTDPAPAV